MNSVSRSFTKRQVQKEFAKMYDEMRCEAFKQNCDDIMQQSIAITLSAMSMHGYTKEQLHEVYEWIIEVISFPDFFGKKLTSAIAIKKCEELGIDLNRVHVGVEMIDNEVKETA